MDTASHTVTWTVAYRKRTGPWFKRADNLSVTWAQARECAQILSKARPDLDIWYVPTAAHEEYERQQIAAGQLPQRYAEDHARIMATGSLDRSRWVRVREGGSYDLAIPDADEAQARFNGGAR